MKVASLLKEWRWIKVLMSWCLFSFEFYNANCLQCRGWWQAGKIIMGLELGWWKHPIPSTFSTSLDNIWRYTVSFRNSFLVVLLLVLNIFGLSAMLQKISAVVLKLPPQACQNLSQLCVSINAGEPGPDVSKYLPSFHITTLKAASPGVFFLIQ